MDKLKLKIQRAIINKYLIQFWYNDKSKDKQGIRVIESYLFGVDKNRNYFVSGYDTDPSVPEQKRHKNYLINQMDSGNFEELKEKKYTSLKIDPDKIYKTKETIIICVADFTDLIAKYFL